MPCLQREETGLQVSCEARLEPGPVGPPQPTVGTGIGVVLGQEIVQPACREEVKAVQAVPSRNFAEEAKTEGEREEQQEDMR